MNRLITLLTTTMLLTAMPASAQKLQATLTHYSTDDGLSSNAIAYLGQDDYGYIWIATWNGLTRYDGTSFYNYKTGNASHIPLLHNRIMDFVIDQQQNVWLRMYDGRIFVVNRQTDRIINPFAGISGSQEYRTECPLFLTSKGQVLSIIKGVGIYQMHLSGGKPEMELITANNTTILCLAEGYNNDIWAGTDQGLRRVDMGNMSLERKSLFEDDKVTALFSNGYNIFVGCSNGKIIVHSYGQEPETLRQPSGQEVMSIFVDSRGIIWFADPRFGASRLDPKTHSEKHFEQKVLVPEHDGRGGFFKETGGTVWVRMNHGGYGYYNRETDEVEYFHNDPVNPWNLSNTVNANLELPEGVVFLSTSRRGLEKLEILKKTINRALVVPDAESTIENEIRAMCYDAQRDMLLLGNKNSSLFLIGDNGSRTVIQKDSQGNPLGRLYGISKDSKGNYWLCSKDYGLFRMTWQNGSYTITNYRHNPDDQWSLSSDNAYQTCEDKQGNIWIATYGGGVNVMTRDKQGKTIFYHSGNNMSKYPYNSYQKVRTITADKEGNVWAGTTDGILKLTLKDNQVSIERLEDSKAEPDKTLMSNDIVCLTHDRNGNLWVGTNGGGLSRMTGRDRDGCYTFETFGSKDGLPSEEIRSITFDQRGTAWFATEHIICSFDVNKKIFTTFSSLDGVDETLCSEGAAITLDNGKILIGTLNGYYIIDRQKLSTSNGAILKLRITDFYLNDELQSPRLTSTFDYYVPEAKSVRLPGRNNTFAFRFEAMNYQLRHRITYQYMLEGYDKQWHNADKSHTAHYANVPAGTYHFKVKAFLLESPENYDMRTIEVVVPPNFLLSEGAIRIYLVLAALLAIWFMFWRQRKLAQRFGQPSGAQATHSSEEAGEGPQPSPTPDPAKQARNEKFEAIMARLRNKKNGVQEEKTDNYEVIDE